MPPASSAAIARAPSRPNDRPPCSSRTDHLLELIVLSGEQPVGSFIGGSHLRNDRPQRISLTMRGDLLHVYLLPSMSRGQSSDSNQDQLVNPFSPRLVAPFSKHFQRRTTGLRSRSSMMHINSMNLSEQIPCHRTLCCHAELRRSSLGARPV